MAGLFADPPGPPLYPPRTEEGYISWEQDPAGLNNIRLQASLAAGCHLGALAPKAPKARCRLRV